MTEQLFNPQLRAARFLPRTVITSRTLPTLRLLTKVAGMAQRPGGEVVAVDNDVSVRVFRPTSTRGQGTTVKGEVTRRSGPALLWIHGGGMVLGAAAQDSRFCCRIAEQLDIVVVSVEYRLAPEHPARYDDLSGLPPAWIGVGTNDLFYDEDIAYARRLQEAGVECALHVVPGAYHAFDSVEAKTAISQTFFHAQLAALDEALNGS